MKSRIDQAITNLVTLANIAENDTVEEIAVDTAELLFEHSEAQVHPIIVGLIMFSLGALAGGWYAIYKLGGG